MKKENENLILKRKGKKEIKKETKRSKEQNN
jgi:hypothetical protein